MTPQRPDSCFFPRPKSLICVLLTAHCTYFNMNFTTQLKQMERHPSIWRALFQTDQSPIKFNVPDKNSCGSTETQKVTDECRYSHCKSPQKQCLSCSEKPCPAPVKRIILGPSGKTYCTTVCLQGMRHFHVQCHCYS